MKPDGQDVSATLTGTPLAQRNAPLFWEYGRNDTSFGYPKTPGDKSPNVAMRDGQWKLLVNADGTDAQLYDLSTDPAEKQNLADQQTERTTDLTRRALAWRKSLP
jgi:arylsulfatase A-like enzyme